MQFSPIATRIAWAMWILPLAIATAAWVWHVTAPESLWHAADALQPFSFRVTSFVAMPVAYDLVLPVHSTH